MNTTLVIMAAGMWSRYGWLKQIDAFGPDNETLLEYAVYDAWQAWFTKVVFVIREDFADVFKQKIWTKLPVELDVCYVYQSMTSKLPHVFDTTYREKPRGTGHAVLVAEDVVNEPFCVINADDYYGKEWFELMQSYLQHIQPHQCCMIWYGLKNTLSPHGSVNRWICTINDSHDLVWVKEHHKIVQKDELLAEDMHHNELSLDVLVSMNFRWFHPSIFAAIQGYFTDFIQAFPADTKREFYIPLVVNNFIQNEWSSCKVLPCEAQRCGVTYPEDKQRTQAVLQGFINDWIYPTPLFSSI